MPDVTVLMSVYNDMPYLPDAVESIRRQTLEDWRFVILDDGSTDESAAYLDGLRDPRIRVLHGPNVGLAAALNRGFELCDTEFLARMDGDDVARPERLAEQLDFLRRRPEVGLVGSQIEQIGSVRTGGRSRLPCDHASIVDQLLHGRPAMYHSTMTCRTALLKAAGGYRFNTAAQDWDMFLRMSEQAELANLDRVLLSFRFHASSVTVGRMAEARARIAYFCDCAQRRRSGAEEIDYEAFDADRRARPFWRRLAERADVYARRQYRLAVGEMLGDRPIRGRARLAWAAAWSPRLTWRRIARTCRGAARSPATEEKDVQSNRTEPSIGDAAGGLYETDL